MIHLRLPALLLIATLAGFSHAYRCAGKKCDDSRLTPADCAVYVERIVKLPIQPTSVPKKPVLVGSAISEPCSVDQRTISVSVATTKTDKETVTVTGSLAHTFGAEMKASIASMVEFKGNAGQTTTDTNSYAYESTFAFAITESESRQIGGLIPIKGYMNAFVFRRLANFTQDAYSVGEWENAGGCFTTSPCAQTSGQGFAEVWSPTVRFRTRQVKCLCPEPSGPVG